MGRLGGLEVAARCAEGTGFTGFQTPGTGVEFNLETRGVLGRGRFPAGAQRRGEDGT